MRQGIYRPGRSVQRVTANAGNRAFIRGGLLRRAASAAPPEFIGPAIANQTAAVGVPFSYAAGAHFTGDGVYERTGPSGGWLVIDPATGVLSGIPQAAGTLSAQLVRLVNADLAAVAESNAFTITVT